MDDNRNPAWKGDLQDLESRLDGKLDSVEQRILDGVDTAIREAETRLLQAFYSFAESNQKRMTETERETAALKDRLATVESRLMEVEKRLNMPPAA